MRENESHWSEHLATIESDKTLGNGTFCQPSTNYNLSKGFLNVSLCRMS